MNFSQVKVFLRTLWRNKLYTAITVFGFALALTFVILLGSYIRQELSVDQFHRNKDRIFHAEREKGSYFGPLIGPELKNKFPEIEEFTRLSEMTGYVVNSEKEKITFNFLLADPSFFRIFSFRLLEGDPAEVLQIRNGVVLTRSYARKLFENEPALGKEINYGGEFRLQVTGIMEDMPENTHFNSCDGILNFVFMADMWHYPQALADNSNSSYGLYFLAKPGTDLPSKASAVLEDFKEHYWLYQREYAKEFQFTPLTQVYFGGKWGQGIHGNSKVLVVVLSAIALVILILALINYTNLSVAQAGFRAKEAAVKKLLGTDNRHIFRQFVYESVGLCLISFGIALLLSLLLQPVFGRLLDTSVSIFGNLGPVAVFLSFVSVVLLGLVAGLTPAFLMTRFQPVDVVKGAFRKKTKGVYSKVLICFQYTVAIALIICTLGILKQTRFMRHYDLGFSKENTVWLDNYVSQAQMEALRSEFLKIPEVSGVSFVCGTPMDGGNNNSFNYQGRPVSFQVFSVDTAFFRLLNIRVESAGAARSGRGIWLNKAAVKELELGDSPLEFKPDTNSLPVLGIADNFHFRDLTENVGPAMIRLMGPNEFPWTILVKMKGNEPAGTYREIRKVYSIFIDGIPFESGFMDQEIDRWYDTYEKAAQLIGYFSLLAIFLSMMGILAMATYFIHQRVKEIGVRRVNGASAGEILRMLVAGFMKWILLAFVIACPLAWWFMANWLNGFAYRTSLSGWIFAVAGFFACAVALLMVGWQSLRVAMTNPVNSLKSE